MMRDIFGRPLAPRPVRSPWPERRAPARPVPFGAPIPAPYRDVPWAEARRPVENEPDPSRSIQPPSVPPPSAAPTSVEPPSTERTTPAASPSSGSVASPAAQLAEARAELEASRGRLAREAVREREAEKLRLAGEVLPVLDDLDRSIVAARRDGDVKPALIEGFELVRARLERVLDGYGLERIPALGERFDPAVHDAIGLVEVDDPADGGMVLDEIERGYRAGGRVVRPARVRVGVAA